MTLDEFVAEIKEHIEDEDYNGDFSTMDIEIDDTDSYGCDSEDGIVTFSYTISVSFVSSDAKKQYEQKELEKKLMAEAIRKIKMDIYGSDE